MDNSVPTSPDTPLRLIMTAAHGGSNSERIPLGGGAAICERLCRVWRNDPRLELTLMAPGREAPEGVKYHRLDVLGDKAPSSLNELAYARFCRAFEKELTAEILRLRPDVVLTHDLSEGPNYAMLQRYGIPCIPIYHVDVVNFFCQMYLRSLITPRQAEAIWRCLRPYPLLPDVLRLVFDKQAESVQFCPHLIVPSDEMKRVLEDTYPDMPAERVAVIPWGSPQVPFSEDEIVQATQELNERYHLAPQERVVITLSRISPEKGQDLLLQGLIDSGTEPLAPPTTLFICGKGAFMGGERFYAHLQQLARRVRNLRVIFPGHLGGLDKVAMLRRADVFVSASRHESYGLTTMEAMLQHTAILATDTAGTRQTVTADCAFIIPHDSDIPYHLSEGLRFLLSNDERRQELADCAQRRAQKITFLKAAEQIYSLLNSCRGQR